MTNLSKNIEKYGWIIDVDVFDGEATGVTGPRGGMEVPEGEGEEFRMYDDDGVLYAEGRIVGDYDGFEPLDDFGEGNWGCIGVKYKGVDGWQYL